MACFDEVVELIFITLIIRRKQMITSSDDLNTVPIPTDIGAAPSSIEGPSDPTDVNWYMQKAELPRREQIGEEKRVLACDVTAQQGAFNFGSGHPETGIYNPPKGWVIVSHEPVEVLENRHSYGSVTVDFAAAGLNFSINEQEIGDKWKVAEDLAVKYGDVEVSTKLNVEYEQHQQLIRSIQTNTETVFLKVIANGGLFRKSVIHARQYVVIKHIF
jgi:hypothetical protein